MGRQSRRSPAREPQWLLRRHEEIATLRLTAIGNAIDAIHFPIDINT
jgi:hypothetical protein